LDATLSIADVVYKNTTPKLVKDIIGTFGINDAAVMNYKLGRNTDEFLETDRCLNALFQNVEGDGCWRDGQLPQQPAGSCP
jgi:hypothetical protein